MQRIYFFSYFVTLVTVESLVSFVVGPHYTRDSFVPLSKNKARKTSLTGCVTDGTNIKNKNIISCLLHSRIT